MPHALSTRSPLRALELGLALGPGPLGQLGREDLHRLRLVLVLAALVLARPRRSPVGRWVSRTAESVLLTCWPPAPDERYVSMRRSFSSISTSSETSSRNGVTSTEAKLVWRRCCESNGDMRTRRCTPRSVASKPVGEAAVHDERRRQQPGLLSLRRLVELDGEAAALRPALVHAQHHLGPVLRVGAAGAGVDFGHRVELVVLAREQRLQLERVEARAERVDRLDELDVEGGVTGAGRGRLGRQLEEGVGVVERGPEAVELLEVVGDPAELAW